LRSDYVGLERNLQTGELTLNDTVTNLQTITQSTAADILKNLVLGGPISLGQALANNQAARESVTDLMLRSSPLATTLALDSLLQTSYVVGFNSQDLPKSVENFIRKIPLGSSILKNTLKNTGGAFEAKLFATSDLRLQFDVSAKQSVFAYAGSSLLTGTLIERIEIDFKKLDLKDFDFGDSTFFGLHLDRRSITGVDVLNITTPERLPFLSKSISRKIGRLPQGRISALQFRFDQRTNNPSFGSSISIQPFFKLPISTGIRFRGTENRIQNIENERIRGVYRGLLDVSRNADYDRILNQMEKVKRQLAEMLLGRFELN